jgi:FKBP-type peptidyl-prolyl cis-trans isomerase
VAFSADSSLLTTRVSYILLPATASRSPKPHVMTFFGAEVTAKEMTWVEGAPDAPVQLSHACLSKLGKKKDGRVVLQICRSADDGSEASDGQSNAGNPGNVRTAIVGVLSASDGGADNIHLELVINCRMGLRLVGPGAAGGAAIHVVGSLLEPVDFDDDGGNCGGHCDGGNVYAHDDSDGGESDGSDSSLDLEDPAVLQMLRDHGLDIGDMETSDSDDVDMIAGERDGSDGDRVEQESDVANAPAYVSKKAKEKAGKQTEVPSGTSKAVVPKSQTAFVTHKSGLRYQDLMVGAGKAAVKGKNVAINYTLRTESGKVVDKSGSKAFKFRLGIGEVIKGMDIGVLGMREGGERHLIIPANLGYGKEGSPPAIPRNATLFFDVALVRAWA